MDRIPVFPGLDDPIAYARALASRVSATYPACVHAEDLAAEGLLALVLALRRFDPRRGVRFSTYGWGRAHGAMLDQIRKEIRCRSLLRSQDLPDFPAETTTEEVAAEHDQVDHFHRAVDRLPLRQKAFVKELLEGRTEVDVCHRMGITRGAGRELRVRAFGNLKRALVSVPEPSTTAAGWEPTTRGAARLLCGSS